MITLDKNRFALCTCVLMLSFIPFDWSLFLKVSIWELNCYEREGNHWKGKRCNFETLDIVLMVDENSPRNLWPLGHILEVKPKKRDGLMKRVTLKTKSAVLECPINTWSFFQRVLDSTKAALLLFLMSSSEKFACNVREQLFLFLT